MRSRSNFYRTCVKPALDRLIAAIALMLCAPILVCIALAVRLKLGSPVLFAQIRPGLGGQPFRMYKFRTMTSARDEEGELLPDADRLTAFGNWLRSTSLDELPELWNVLRGEMSIVGPRPLLMQYVDLYTPEQLRRHDVKPGLTGLAQVYGRNAISWERKFAYDLQYVERFSPWLDLKILIMSVVRVLNRDGISAESHCTMPFFTGTERDSDEPRSTAA
jgi:lipopolysaccharide/colanic/teichoic acid biosynthesis glycosyltransferase